MVDDSLKINIQPIFNTYTLKQESAEVLLRCSNKDVAIADVIKSFEVADRHIELDRLVLSKTLKILKDNINIQSQLSVNLCKKTIETRDIYKKLLMLVDSYKVEHYRLIFEVNEHTDLNNLNVIRNINCIAETGIHVAIDDYGIGGNCLADLGVINSTIVKFDKTFLDDNSINETIRLKKIVGSLTKLGIDTVIEGIETDNQMELARSIGYRKMQGFLLSRPLEVDEYIKKYGGGNE